MIERLIQTFLYSTGKETIPSRNGDMLRLGEIERYEQRYYLDEEFCGERAGELNGTGLRDVKTHNHTFLPKDKLPLPCELSLSSEWHKNKVAELRECTGCASRFQSPLRIPLVRSIEQGEPHPGLQPTGLCSHSMGNGRVSEMRPFGPCREACI